MLSFRIIARRAPFHATRRVLPLTVVAFLLATAFGASVPARAQSTQEDPTPPASIVRDHRDGQGPVWRAPRANADPNAPPPIVRDHREIGRLEVAINKVHIFDDRDWGEGEIRLRVSVLKLRECSEAERGGLDFCRSIIAEGTIRFNADSGEDVVLNRIVPGPGDDVADASIGAGIGFPISAGPGYLLAISGYEIDTVDDDALGVVNRDLSEQNGWGPLGTYDERGTYCEMKGFFHHYSKCGILAKYSVEYEIRRVPLPDLQPIAFRVNAESPRPGGDAQICFTTQNRGLLASEPFQVVIEFGGAEQTVLTTGASELGAGETREQCTSQRLPEPGTHPVMVTIDPERRVPEMDEGNNVFKQVVVRTPATQPGPTPAPSPGPESGPILIASQGRGKDDGQGQAQTQGQGQANLTVSAIKVNGQVPDGKEDCKDGKNAVTVTIKNEGATKTGAFVVRLAVDAGEAIEETVDGLEAGKEREVKLDDVRLKKGAQKLTVTVDPKGAVAESNEENNERQVTARCKADN